MPLHKKLISRRCGESQFTSERGHHDTNTAEETLDQCLRRAFHCAVILWTPRRAISAPKKCHRSLTPHGFSPAWEAGEVISVRRVGKNVVRFVHETGAVSAFHRLSSAARRARNGMRVRGLPANRIALPSTGRAGDGRARHAAGDLGTPISGLVTSTKTHCDSMDLFAVISRSMRL